MNNTDFRVLVPQTIINFCKHLPLAFFANVIYGFPSKKMRIVGVTGTDGKTTTVSLIHHILSSLDYKTAMVSTVLAKIGNEEIDTGFHVTAPDPLLLQKLLRKMVKKKMEVAVLEATSHGLDQFRLLGIHFEVGVLTNITHEHLDYHKTFENYRLAKLKMLLKSKTVILNRDDESFDFIMEKLANKGIRVLTYSLRKEADITLQKFSFKTDLLGEHNQYNILAAIGALTAMNISKDKILKSIASFKGVDGRLKEIGKGKNFRVFVDFAHTPNALEQVLKTLRTILPSKSKLIAVYGAAGMRDKEKRPMMGKISGELGDISVLTAEDPRTENVSEIIEQIASGCRESGGIEGKSFYQEPDRQKAINFAIQKLAKKGDIVVVCGKGHEQSMCFGTTEYPWSDEEAVKKALNVGAQRVAPVEKKGGK